MFLSEDYWVFPVLFFLGKAISVCRAQAGSLGSVKLCTTRHMQGSCLLPLQLCQQRPARGGELPCSGDEQPPYCHGQSHLLEHWSSPCCASHLGGAAHHNGPPSSHRAAHGGHGAGAKGSLGGAVHALSSSAAWEMEHLAATGWSGQAAAWNLPMPPRRCEEEPSFLQKPSGKSCLWLKWMLSNTDASTVLSIEIPGGWELTPGTQQRII